ncbi:uncharacterized protein (TIGR02217 family) [Nitrospirillum amazonense]|uniref:Uncharacterized protein (TIGR02217 family) n=1 Tax=Nitrospirillum amazonense TaxID=28077 RepID=A0A560KH17_9PROT|nr:DUF2460 domain-containing protein [Nitrospirillum amazonense]TWB82598.1 uncharacterized protein (TIGR02217 family) [Nitrospirillum amazonense]
MTAIYPTLAGLGYSVTKKPTLSTKIATAASGRETRMAMWSAPLWEFQLSYDFLRDTAAANELKQLLGFYLQMQGAFMPFLFQDPDDGQATAQTIAVGDGAAASFTLVRTFGGYVEPVGGVIGGVTVYVNGARQTSGYSVAGNVLTFASAPGAGTVISADFQYAFLCRFKDDGLEFEKFAAQLWQAKQVNLISVRA